MTQEALSISRPVETIPWSDRLGIYASALCVVHCLLTPVLLSLSAVAAHFLPSEEHTHRALAVGIALIGSFAVFRGLRKHRRRIVVWLMLVGLMLIAVAAFFGDSLPHHWIEVFITMCGSTCMIAAHRLNHTFCKQCSCVPNPSAAGLECARGSQ